MNKDSFKEKAEAILIDFYGERYCGRCEDYHGLMESDKPELNRAVNQLISAHQEAVKEIIGENGDPSTTESYGKSSIIMIKNELRHEQRQRAGLDKEQNET